MNEVDAREIGHRFSGCYCGIIQKSGKIVTGRMVGVDFQGGSWICVLESHNSRHTFDLDVVEVINPLHLRLLNHKGEMLLYSRRPLRQFRKGYTRDNTIFVSVLASFMNDNGLECRVPVGRDVSLEYVESLFNGDFALTYEKAIENITSQKAISCAVNEYYGVGLSCVADSDYVLFYLHKPIALIKDKTFTVLSLKQEVVDFVKYFSKGDYNVV